MNAFYRSTTQTLTDFVGALRHPAHRTCTGADLPTLSIITPSYNQAKFLERTIVSVLNQGYPNLEYIIIDGGSTDGSVDIIKKYEKYISYWESERDRGQSHALNKGFMRATGEYVGWQNSDDVYFPDCLPKLGAVAASAKPVIVSGNLMVGDARNRIFRKVHYTPMNLRRLTVVKASIPNQAAIFRRDALARHGYINENMRYCMDLELWARLLQDGSNVIVPHAYGIYTAHEDTKTSTMVHVLDSERAAIIEAIRQADPGLGPLYPLTCRISKLAAHARQGDFPYLLEKMLTKMVGRDTLERIESATAMTLFPRISTLPLLCWCAFTALVFNDEYAMIYVGSFKLSPFDLLFVVILVVKFARLAEPTAYRLPTGQLAVVMAATVLGMGYLLVMAGHQPDIVGADVLRDLRVVFYFVLTPFLCYKDIQTPEDYRKVHWYLVASGMAVSLYFLTEQVIGFDPSNPVRDIRIGIWVIPFSIVSLLYFRQQLRVTERKATLMILFMMMALAFSLNRSQYLQLVVAIAAAMVLGKQVNAMRRGLMLFVPTLIAGIAAFTALGYMDILISRVLSVEDLQYDSSYGARIQEYIGQMDFFHQAPLFGHGAGFRSWVMGENGFELSTFAHNSWSFYLMKFGIVGTAMIMTPPLLLLLFSMWRRYADPALELNRRYVIACVPVYIFVDSLSGGLAYAPKTIFIGFLLCYALSLIANGQRTARSAERAQLPTRRIEPARRLPLVSATARVRRLTPGFHERSAMVDVLFVAPDLHRGGVGRCVSFIVDEAPKRGVSAGLFILRGIDQTYTVDNPNVTQGVHRADSSVKLLALLPFTAWKLIRTIARDRPKIVCSHGLLCNLLVGLIKIITAGKFKSVAFEHNAPESHYNLGMMQRLKRGLLSMLYRKHDRIVGVSKGVVNDLERLYPHLRGRCHTIYNGISLCSVRRQSREQDVLAQRTCDAAAAPAGALPDACALADTGPADAIGGDAIHLVALGRLHEVKDYPTLIQAAAILDDPRLCLSIVGTGPAEDELRTLIDQTQTRSRIRLVGHLDNPYPVLRRADVFVLSSQRESFGIVLIEALALGVPIVAANCPFGPAEILNYGEYGVLVPVGNAQALATTLRDLLSDPARRAHFATRGPDRAQAFSLDKHCQDVIDLFHPLLRCMADSRSFT